MSKVVELPIDAIRAATVGGAKLLNRVGELGVIAPGAAADLLLLDADPVADIGVLADIEQHLDLIVQDGVMHSRR